MTTFEITIIFFVAIIAVLLALIYGESAYRTNELKKKIDCVKDSLIGIKSCIDDLPQELINIDTELLYIKGILASIKEDKK